MRRNRAFDILEAAIADVGGWGYWSAHLPDQIQLEFVGVQLRKPSGNTKKRRVDPVALRLLEPACVAFLQYPKADVPRDWPELLASDRLPPQSMRMLAINRPDSAAEAIRLARRVIRHHGPDPKKFAWKKSPTTLVVHAGDVGVVIAAESMQVLSFDGRIPLKGIPGLHNAWWGYWKRYWKSHEGPRPLETDPVCDAVIPAG